MQKHWFYIFDTINIKKADIIIKIDSIKFFKFE